MKKLTPKQQKRRELLTGKNKPYSAPIDTLSLALIALMFSPNFLNSNKPL